MAQPNITFNKSTGGLGQALPGKDHYSAFLFYSDTLPSGFAADDRVKQVFSLEEAENLGIVDGGAFSQYHYHISEYFRIQPKGVLWIGFYAVPVGTYDFAELETMRLFAEGQIRQFGVYVDGLDFAAQEVTALQAEVAKSETAKQPFEVLYAADISGVADLSTLPDLRALTAFGVSVVIGQDGGAEGAALATSLGYSVCAVGTALGAVSLSKVSESIAWVEKFPLVTGAELDVAAFGNGDLFRDKTDSFLDALNDKGYIYLRKFTDVTNTYFNDNPTSIATTSDFSYINLNRTYHKALRDINTVILPKLNSPVTVNADGSLTTDVIVSYKTLASRPLDDMVNNGELSAFEVIVDPDQDVVTSSTIDITVKLVPVGVARQIVFNIGFVPSIA